MVAAPFGRCPGSCLRWLAFTPCSKGMPKWTCVPLVNHPTVTHGPRCRYLVSDKTGTDTRQHVMANHVAAAQEPDEAAHFSCKPRSSWLTGDNELCPICCQAKQTSQTLSGKVMQKTVCCDDIYVRLHLLQELEHVCHNRLDIPV